AVVAVLVPPGHRPYVPDLVGEVAACGRGREEVGQVRADVDEPDDPDLVELRLQRLQQQDREATEPGHRGREVSQANEIRFVRWTDAVGRTHRHPAGRHGTTQRPAQVDPPAVPAAPLRGEPGGELPGQWTDGRAQLGELLRAGEDEEGAVG